MQTTVARYLSRLKVTDGCRFNCFITGGHLENRRLNSRFIDVCVMNDVGHYYQLKRMKLTWVMMQLDEPDKNHDKKKSVYCFIVQRHLVGKVLFVITCINVISKFIHYCVSTNVPCLHHLLIVSRVRTSADILSVSHKLSTEYYFMSSAVHGFGKPTNRLFVYGRSSGVINFGQCGLVRDVVMSYSSI